jgi:hypothetical protein
LLSFAEITALPSLPTTADLSMLATIAVEQRNVIDARLSRPARWRGLMRRERNGTVRAGEKARYVQAYDRLTRLVSSDSGWALDIETLRAIHNEAVGGWSFRDIELRVIGGHVFPPPQSINRALTSALECLAQSSDPAPVKAARAHLQLLGIHPFLDGNGRTARLVASLMLIKDGFRSTLLAAVEQHFGMDPLDYIPLLDRFQYGEIDESSCMAGLMQAMIRSAMYAAWFRGRESRIQARCIELGLEPNWAAALTAYDLGMTRNQNNDEFRLWKAATNGETPLHELIQTLSLKESTRFSAQLQRLLDEELDEAVASH